MKINPVLSIIAIAIAALLGYLAYSLCSKADNATAIGVTSGISFAITLLPMMGLKNENGRIQVNIKVLSTIFLLLFIVIAAVMCYMDVNKLNLYFIIVGIIALIYLGITYSISKIKDV